MENTNFEEFINLYTPQQKTLRFRLIPYGDTEKNIGKERQFKQKKVSTFDNDKAKADKIPEIRNLIDDFHRAHIRENMKEATLSEDTLREFQEAFGKGDKDGLNNAQTSLRKELSEQLSNGNVIGKLSIYKVSDLVTHFIKNWVDEELKSKSLSDEEREHLEKRKELIAEMKGFTTPVSQYATNRQALYKDDTKSTSLANRLINDNLTRYAINIQKLEQIKATVRDEALNHMLQEVNKEMGASFVSDLDELFDITHYNKVLTEDGIKLYNQFIGSNSDNETDNKAKGLNQLLN